MGRPQGLCGACCVLGESGESVCVWRVGGRGWGVDGAVSWDFVLSLFVVCVWEGGEKE